MLTCGAAPITLAMGDPGEVVVDGVPLRRWSCEQHYSAAPNLYGHSHAASQHNTVHMPHRGLMRGPWRAGDQLLSERSPPPPNLTVHDGSASVLIGEQLRRQGRRQQPTRSASFSSLV